MKRFLEDVKRYSSYASYAAKAELKAEVAGSYLNWIWWILEPLCLMLVYAFIFGVVFDAREEYFTAFIFLGLTIWNFFNQNLKNSVKMVKKNRAVVSKIYIPKFIFAESKMMVNAFKMLIALGIVAILLVYYRIPITANMFFVIPLFICLFLITFGLMCVMLHFGVYVEDLSNIITIVLRLVFYMTGIMYSIERRIGVKYPELASVLANGNPMAFLVTSFRKCVLYGEMPNVPIMLIWMAVGGILSVIGVFMIYKNENGYVKVI